MVEPESAKPLIYTRLELANSIALDAPMTNKGFFLSVIAVTLKAVERSAFDSYWRNC